MTEDGYKYDEDGFREDLKNDPNVFTSPTLIGQAGS